MGAYNVQVAHDYASCSCPDWAYRHRHGKEVCKHALALVLYAIDHPEEHKERKPDLTLAKVRSKETRPEVVRDVEALYGKAA